MRRLVLFLAFVSIACGPVNDGSRQGEPITQTNRCGWPQGVDDNSARVDLRVWVEANGRPERVEIVREEPPGKGFAVEAARCVFEFEFVPKEDPSGSPVAGWTDPIPVKFRR